MHIKKDDIVKVISGDDKGTTGKVLQVNTKTNRVIVEKVSMVTKHQKPNKMNQRGGIVHQEAPIHVSNVMLVDEKTGQPTRVRINRTADGKKVRVSVKSGETFKK
jgi:large subunit ribosomal protein L24